jgi:Tol biopolymer transport system component
MTERGLSPGRVGAWAGLSLVLVVALAASAIAAPGPTKLVSRQSAAAGGLGADGNSRAAAISANGRFVVFQTEAGNLGGPIEADSNIYVYDRRRHKAELVSRRSKSKGGQGADKNSSSPTISGNGRFVAFYSAAANLSNAAQGSGNIYVYDRKRDRVQLVSRQSKSKGGAGANGNAEDGVISGNGRFVAFQTIATNLGGPLISSVNHYVYDRERKRVELISRQSKAAGGKGQDAGFYDDHPASITPDGRFVAWTTPATNLGGPIAPGKVNNIYVYDRKRDRVQLVSRHSKADGGGGALGGADAASISRSGRYVAFDVFGNDLGGPAQATTNVYVYDRGRKRVQLVSRRSKASGGAGPPNASSDPSICASGRFVAFQYFGTQLGGPVSNVYNVYSYDRERKRLLLVSRASNGGPGGDGFSQSPSTSDDGDLIAFDSQATNLGGPTNALSNIYVHRR